MTHENSMTYDSMTECQTITVKCPAHRNSNGSFVTLSEPICRKVILGCPFTITYLLLIGTEVIDLLYARVPKYHFDLPFLPCATYLLDPNYLNSGVLGASSHRYLWRPI